MTSVAPEAPTEAQLNADAPPDAPPTAAEPAPPAAAPPPPPAAAHAAAAPSVELVATGSHGQPGSIPHMSHKNSLARAFSASHAEHEKAKSGHEDEAVHVNIAGEALGTNWGERRASLGVLFGGYGFSLDPGGTRDGGSPRRRPRPPR